MRKMCLNCEWFKQEEIHILNELTFGQCTHKEMSRYFSLKEFLPGTLICCIHFKVKQNCADLPEPDVALRNESRTRGARSVLDALDAHKLRREERTDDKSR